MRNVVKEVRWKEEEQRAGAWYTTKNCGVESESSDSNARPGVH